MGKISSILQHLFLSRDLNNWNRFSEPDRLRFTRFRIGNTTVTFSRKRVSRGWYWIPFLRNTRVFNHERNIRRVVVGDPMSWRWSVFIEHRACFSPIRGRTRNVVVPNRPIAHVNYSRGRKRNEKKKRKKKSKMKRKYNNIKRFYFPP